MPAEKAGRFGFPPGLAQGEPLGPESIANESDGWASPFSLHGFRSVVVVKSPQVCGVASAARGPPRKSSVKSSNGSCGLSSKVAVSWPVCGSACTWPGSFTTTPDFGSSTAM